MEGHFAGVITLTSLGGLLNMASYDGRGQGRGEDRWSPGCRKWGQGVRTGAVAG